MKKQASFSSRADYDTRRPYCVVFASGPSVAYDIHSRWSTRKAAETAGERMSLWASVFTIKQVNRANKLASATESARRLAAFGPK